MREQPTGSVTLVFTDIEGSTRLLHELGAEAYRDALADHRRIVREAFGAGYEVDEEGDAFFYAFPTVSSAVVAVEQAMRALDGGPIRIRVGVHTGEPILDPPKYVGLDVHRAARVMAAGHGGQVLLSESARALLEDGVVVRDLGEHRLKDLSGPQRLYQLGADEFPRLKTLHQTNLPVAWTRLVGREHDVEALLELLRRDDVSVVTVTGAGGGGKTRLAMQVAADAAEDYADGVWFVALAALTDASLVEAAIAQTFGLREGGGRTYRDVVGDFLRPRRLLLVLDNLEQLLPDVAGLVADLAAEFGSVEFLATSREPLHIGAEREYTVPPLASDESVVLFAERAGLELDGDRPAVEAICARLDGLPLAIELAAARVNVLPPTKLLERLEQRLPLLTLGSRDAPARQQTLRATIVWSHDLLDDHEQQLFARLAVFAGGCTLEAAEAVCDADLDTLGSLLDKNLLRRDQLRYLMLETIREFARERLDQAAGADEVRRRHAKHCLAFALEAQPELVRRNQREWLDRLEADHDNLRAAVSWLLDHEPEDALELAHGLVVFWYTRGHVREGRDWLVTALEHASATVSGTRASALDWAGYLSKELGEDGSALVEQAVACARAADAPAALALALGHLPYVAFGPDEIDKDVLVAEEALAIAERAGDPFTLGVVLNNLATAYYLRGEFARSRTLHEESYRVRAEMGDLSRMALSLNNLAWSLYRDGDTSHARDLGTRALTLAREVGDRRHTATALNTLGWMALIEDDLNEACALFEESLAIALEIAFRSLLYDGLFGLAAVAGAGGDWRLAARLEAAAAAEIHVEVVLDSWAKGLLDQSRAAAQAQTDPARWEAAWAAGATLTIEQATAEVLKT
jgi:predicted ATPase/class 3 adenylate cyclase